MSGSVFQAAFELAYSISPIILTGGIAAQIPGQALPIVALTEGAAFIAGALAGSIPTSLDQFFAHFTVIPNGSLIAQQIGHYPFANQTVASNAVITLPLKISVRMDCPANSAGSYVSKLAILTALQATLSAHNASGGLYTVLTPGFPYVNLLMENLTDISGAGSQQVQYQWQFDFEQPLVTLQAAQQAYSGLLNKISGGTQISSTPSWSGVDAVTGSASGTSTLTSQATTTAPVIPVTQTPLAAPQ